MRLSVGIGCAAAVMVVAACAESPTGLQSDGCAHASLAADEAPHTPGSESTCGYRTAVMLPWSEPAGGSDDVRVVDLNDRREVLAFVEGGWIVASAHATRVLQPPAGVSASGVEAVDLNDEGEVLGYFTDGAAQTAAILWNSEGVPRLVPVPGSGVRAVALNDSGWLLGARAGSAWIRTPQGEILQIWQPGPEPRGVDIDEEGRVLGYIHYSPRCMEVFVWTRGSGRSEVLDSCGSGYAPVALNASGQAVGNAGYPNGISSTFLWTAEAGMRDLRLESGLVGAIDINDSGEVLGVRVIDGREQLVTWMEGRGTFDVVDPALGATELRAFAFNNRDEILGEIVRDGVEQPVVWTFNPEQYR